MPDPTPEAQEMRNAIENLAHNSYDFNDEYVEDVDEIMALIAADKERSVREARIDENDRAFDNLLPTTLKPDPGNDSGEVRVNTDLAYEYRNRRRAELQSHQEKETK